MSDSAGSRDICLHFLRAGGGEGQDALLRISGAGATSADAEVKLVREGNRWVAREPSRWEAKEFGVAARIQGKSDASSVEIFLKECSGGGESTVKLEWEKPPRSPGPGGAIGALKIGVYWLPVDDAWLPIVTLPRHLVHKDDPAGLRDAMDRLNRMVADLWDWAENHDLHIENAQGDPPDGGASARRGSRSTYWRCRLRRLHDLLFGAGGVEAAWYALMADPVVRLESQYPIEPIHYARRPVLAGSRGPWTLAGGWSPERPDGLVRDRVVVRTGDTPPNRLAVGLARLVLRELEDIRAAAEDEARALGGHPAFEPPWLDFFERSQQLAESVLWSPAFRDVPRDAEVPLDSPALQNSGRTRKLLEAWAKLLSGLDRELDWLVQDVLTEPITKSWLLYERWCFVALCKALALHYLPERSVVAKGKWLSWTAMAPSGAVNGPRKATVLLSMETRPDFMSEDTNESGTADRPDVRSWSWPSTPDGFIIFDDKHPHAWDAKYRLLKDDRYKAGYVYQAHAFRDAVTYRGKRIRWSLVLHPGLMEGKMPKEPEECELFQSIHSQVTGGVQLVPVWPPAGLSDQSQNQPADDGLRGLKSLVDDLRADLRKEQA